MQRPAGAGREAGYLLYDGTTPVVELDAAGNAVAVNTFGVSGLLARRSGGSSTFYAFDPQGNVSQRLGAGGTVLSSHLYDAYGQEASSAATTDPFGYGGQSGYYRDAETGLHQLTFRYHDTAAGRFLNRDPIGYAGA